MGPTVFIWEGVTSYLSAAAVDATLRRLATLAAPRSQLIFTYLDHSTLEGRSELPGARTAMAAVRHTGEPSASASIQPSYPPTSTTVASSSPTISRRSISPPATCIPSVGGPSPAASTTSPSPLARARALAVRRSAGAASEMWGSSCEGARFCIRPHPSAPASALSGEGLRRAKPRVSSL